MEVGGDAGSARGVSYACVGGGMLPCGVVGMFVCSVHRERVFNGYESKARSVFHRRITSTTYCRWAGQGLPNNNTPVYTISVHDKNYASTVLPEESDRHMFYSALFLVGSKLKDGTLSHLLIDARIVDPQVKLARLAPHPLR